jgi:hypothetical protein
LRDFKIAKPSVTNVFAVVFPELHAKQIAATVRYVKQAEGAGAKCLSGDAEREHD